MGRKGKEIRALLLRARQRANGRKGAGRVEPRLRVVEVESRETPAHGEACFTTISAQEMMSLN